MNNLIFILHTVIIALVTLFANQLGKQFIVSTLAIFAVLANLFVLKQINLFGLQVTSSDAFIVGISLGLNLMQEKYGQKEAQNIVWTSFWCLMIYTILSQFQLWYRPNLLDTAHMHFDNLLSLAPRLTLASLCSYLISQTLDVKLYAFCKNNFKFNSFIQNYGSMAISQLADTLIFSIIGLAGLNYNLSDIICFSYLIKLLAITISVLTSLLYKKILNQKIKSQN